MTQDTWNSVKRYNLLLPASTFIGLDVWWCFSGAHWECPVYLDVMAQLCHQLDGTMACNLYSLLLRLWQNKSNVCAQGMTLDLGKCSEQVTQLSVSLLSVCHWCLKSCGSAWSAAGLSFTCKCRAQSSHVTCVASTQIIYLIYSLLQWLNVLWPHFSKLREWPENDLWSMLCLNTSCADTDRGLI